MEEWKEYKISDTIEDISMGPFGSNIKVENFCIFGIPVLNGSNLQGIKLKEKSFNFVTEEKANSLGKANARRGDIVVTHRGTLGQIVYIPQTSKYDRYVISQSQFRLRLKDKLVRPDFFTYFFHTRLGQHKILVNVSQVGVPALARPTSTFKDVTIPVPSMKIQDKIMKIILPLDDKIELNNRINANLEEQAQALFRRWFVDFEFPNEQGLPYKSNGGKFVESELGKIPEGWNFNQLNYFGKIVCGKTPSKSIEDYFGGNIPFIKIPDMHNNIFVINSEDSLSSCGERSQSNKTIPPYSILVSCIATVGLVCINTKKSQFNQQINAIIPFHESFRYYIYLKLKTMYNKLQLLASGGSATLNLNTGQFSAIKIENPNKKLIIDFHKITTPFFKEIELRQNENIYLTQLRDSLLPKLMNNEIKI